MIVTIPNLLSGLRLMLGPIMLYLAWQGEALIFLVLMGIALFSDLLDGLLARYLNQVTELGAQLDSWGDFVTYWVLAFGMLWLWPEVVEREQFYIAVIGCSYLLSLLAGLLKFHRFLLSYHTWGVKLSAVAISGTLFLMLAFDWIWPFHFAAFFFALTQLEEVAITLVLRCWRSDVSSLWHALHDTRTENGR